MEILNKAADLGVKNHTTRVHEYRAWSYLYFYHDYENTLKDVEHIEKTTGHPTTACHGEPCLLLKAQALYQLEKYEEAITVFNQLLESEKQKGFDPLNQFLAYYYLGLSYAKSNQTEKAIDTFQKQLAVYDNFMEMHYQIGKLYQKQKNTEKAIFHLQKAKELLSNNIIGLNEPYVERFDAVYMYEIDAELQTMTDKSIKFDNH